MPLANRQDFPGSWHHVMNRGIARRTVFETREDIRFFLSRVAGICRLGLLELHAFAILSTHFHLLVRSPQGRLSTALMWIEHAYVRRFNRGRHRDGSLFRGRFCSRRVDSWSYWRTLLRYIDDNPVAASVVDRPTEYPWCSAWHYSQNPKAPWLARAEVERVVSEELGRGRYSPADYAAVCSVTNPETARWIVERRQRQKNTSQVDQFDDLVNSAPAAVLEWMRRKARLADGTRIRDVVAGPESIIKAVATVLSTTSNGHRSRDPTVDTCTIGVLHDLTGMFHREIAARLHLPRSTVTDRLKVHSQRLLQDEAYGALVSRIAELALRSSIPGAVPGESLRRLPSYFPRDGRTESGPVSPRQ